MAGDSTGALPSSIGADPGTLLDAGTGTAVDPAPDPAPDPAIGPAVEPAVPQPAPDGRLRPARLAEVLAGVCAVAGLDPTGAQLVKFTANAVFRLPRDHVVVRIVGSRAMRHRVAKVVAVANWLAGHDVPAVRLLPGVPQPIAAGPYLATLWHEVPAGGRRPTTRDLANMLRRVHELPVPAFALPEWAPLDDVKRRLTDSEGLDPADREFLEGRCAELAEQLATLDFPHGRCVVHGDAHLGNLIPGPHGPVLCDFDATSIGPPEWDLTPLPVGLRRFGGPRRAYRDFARTYGFDVTRWSGFPVLREVRELKLVTAVLPILRSNPAIVPELHRRLSSYRSGDHTASWSRFASADTRS